MFDVSVEIRTFFIFVVLAIIRTILDIGLWRLLVAVFQEKYVQVSIMDRLGINHYGLAQAVSFIVSAAISYYANKELAFQNYANDSLELVLKFIFVTTLGLVASVWVIDYLTENEKIINFIKPYNILYNHWPLIAKLLTVGVTLVINYGGMRFWVFV